MKRNPVETILGFCVIILTIAFLFFALSKVDTKKIDGYQVNASFLKIGGLEVGSDVRIAGIKVGSVVGVKLNPETYIADVALYIDNQVKLSIDTTASIADVGIMGGKYINLKNGASNAYIMPNGFISNTQNYKSLEDNIAEFIFLSTK